MADGFHPHTPARGCGTGPMAGTTALQEAALRRWAAAGAHTMGIFNCRKIAGTLTWSVHAEGRALDLGVPPQLHELGSEILEAVTKTPGRLGLQRVIYRGIIWDATAPGGRLFDDDGAHKDHLHLEQSRVGAATLTQDQAAAVLGGLSPVEEDVQVDHLVRYGGLWLVAQDLSSKTPLASTADVNALLAGGKVKQTILSAAQMEKIPTVDTQAESQE